MDHSWNVGSIPRTTKRNLKPQWWYKNSKNLIQLENGQKMAMDEMNQENVAYKHNGGLFNHKEQWNHVISEK